MEQQGLSLRMVKRLYNEVPEYRPFRAVTVINANLLVDADRLEFRPDRLLAAVEQRARAIAGDRPSAAALKAVMERTAGIRRPGSAALDLAYVAAGRLDGFWELGLSKWDMAAGALLITEAGGLVGDLQGNEGYLESGNIVAGNPKVFAQLLPLLAPHLTPALKSA